MILEVWCISLDDPILGKTFVAAMGNALNLDLSFSTEVDSQSAGDRYEAYDNMSTENGPTLLKTALKARVRLMLRSSRAKRVAKSTFASLRKTCQEVIRKRGAATRG